MSWNSRLRPRKYCSISFGESKKCRDDITKKLIHQSIAVNLWNSEQSQSTKYHSFNATTLALSYVDGRMADPFTGLRLRPQDEKKVRQLAKSILYTK